MANGQFPIPSVGFFRTGNLDNIFLNTGSEIKAFGINPSQGNQPPQGLDIESLPIFNSGFITDFAKQLTGNPQITAEQFDPALLSQFGPAGQSSLTPQTFQTTPLNQINQQGNQQNNQQSPQITQNLQFGSQGAEVTKLQEFLIGQGFNISAGATGYFGNQTKTALAEFQKKNDITSNATELGFFGPKTKAFLSQSGQSTPQTGVTSPAISGVSSLFFNAEIAQLEDIIQQQSENLAAGIGAGGAVEILEGLFDKFGISEEMTMVNEYSALILEKTKQLRDLPDDIRETMNKVGVSEAQLNRLITRESQKPLEVLRDLMEQRGAAQDRINQSLRFVGLFADAAMQDRAARIEAAKFELQTNKDLLARLDKRQQDFMNLALDERKDIMSIAADMQGAPQELIDAVLGAESTEDAIRLSSGWFSEKERQDTYNDNLKSLFNSLSGDLTRDANLIRSFSAIHGIDATSVIPQLEGGGIDGFGELNKTDRNDLLGQGFTPVEITDIERAVADFGIEAILRAIDDVEQRSIVAEKYNAQNILFEIEEAEEDSDIPKWWQIWNIFLR